MYTIGQYFLLSPSFEGYDEELYQLVHAGAEVVLIEQKSGNRWCSGHGVEGRVIIDEEEFARVASGQPERFRPVKVTFTVVEELPDPEWEV